MLGCCSVALCLQVITRILQSSTPAVKLRATDILLSALAHDPMPLRNFLASTNGRQLLASLVLEFVSSDESGLPEQIAELLKLLVDPGVWGTHSGVAWASSGCRAKAVGWHTGRGHTQQGCMGKQWCCRGAKVGCLGHTAVGVGCQSSAWGGRDTVFSALCAEAGSGVAEAGSCGRVLMV